MGRIVAISGGTLESTELLNKHIIKLSNKSNPNVLFVPTASKDEARYITSFTDAFNKLGAKVETIAFSKKDYSEKELQRLVDWADVVYVGDGNIVWLINTWRKHRFDEILYRAFTSDSLVLSGIGAGCTCWFNCGYSNSHYNRGESDWNYIWSDNLLDLHHTAVCPHYNEAAIKGFDLHLVDTGLPGFALEDNTAFTQNGDRSLFLKSVENAHAYYLVYLAGEISHKEIKLVRADQVQDDNQVTELP